MYIGRKLALEGSAHKRSIGVARFCRIRSTVAPGGKTLVSEPGASVVSARILSTG